MCSPKPQSETRSSEAGEESLVLPVLALKMEEAALGERGVRFVGIVHKVRQLRGCYIAYVEPLSFKLAAWKVAAGAGPLRL